jgi:DNA-binding MarR family transcriptional regulator
LNKLKNNSIEEPLGRLLSYTGKSFLSLLNARLSYLDIKRNYYALTLIEQADGKMTQQDLAALLNTNKVIVVRIVDYLAGKGYIERIKDTSDRRKYRLSITAKAKKELPGIKNSLNEVIQTALKGIEESKVKELYAILNVIKSNIKEAETSL